MEFHAAHPLQIYRAEPRQPAVPAAFPMQLGEQGVHEVCEAAFGDMPMLAGFALAAAKPRRGAIAWVSQASLALDHGRITLAGIRHFRRDPSPVIFMRTRTQIDTLWTIEEAVKSAAVGLVVAEVAVVDFTASRRLALASSRYGVPVILLLPYTCEGSTAASARWRVHARPSSLNPFDPLAPGHTRWRAVLERSRQAPQMTGHVFDIEMNDETLSLSVVSGLAPDSPEAITRHAPLRQSA